MMSTIVGRFDAVVDMTCLQTEAQFSDESRVTPTADVIEQMHFTPGIRFSATATAAYTC